jgi:putative transposase
MLDRIKMARATFYYHLKRLNKPDGYDDIRSRIGVIFYLNHGWYGYRRITEQLHNDGIRINHKTVLKLMRQMGLQANRKKPKYKPYKGDLGKVAPNILEQNFVATRPNQKWTTDVTEINIHGEKLYLSPILDMYNGEIISFSISRSPNLNLAISMLNKAFSKIKDTEGMVMHSDQGWQYQHLLYQNMLKNKGIIQSMSRKGNCLDNAIMESFFGIMKSELLYSREWESADEFAMALHAYIHYYNHKRIKMKLNGKSPVQYRTLYQSNY